MSNKIYVGGGKVVNGNFGLFHRISFNKKDLETMLNNLNSKGYINLNMNERREPSQYGQTHSLVIDTWEPTNSQEPKNNPQPNLHAQTFVTPLKEAQNVDAPSRRAREYHHQTPNEYDSGE